MRELMLNDLISQMNEKKAASMHISAGLPPLFNIHGRLVPALAEKLQEKAIDDIALMLMNARQQDIFKNNNSILSIISNTINGFIVIKISITSIHFY